MLNEKDYKYFDAAVRTINNCKMTKFQAKEELLLTLGNFAHGACERIKKDEGSRTELLNNLLEIHAEYEAILNKIEEMKGAEKE